LNEVAFNFNGNDLNIQDVGLWKKPSGYNVQSLFNVNAARRGPFLRFPKSGMELRLYQRRYYAIEFIVAKLRKSDTAV
jgi:hypothetical protein